MRERELQRQAEELMESVPIGRAFTITNRESAAEVELTFPGGWVVQFDVSRGRSFKVVRGYDFNYKPEFTFRSKP